MNKLITAFVAVLFAFSVSAFAADAATDTAAPAKATTHVAKAHHMAKTHHVVKKAPVAAKKEDAAK